MTWFSNLKIGRRLALAFFVLVAMLVVSAVVSVGKMGGLNANTASVTQNAVPSVRITEQINTSASDFRILQLQHVITGSKSETAKLEGAMAAKSAAIEKLAAAYTPLISDAKDQAFVVWSQTSGADGVPVIKNVGSAKVVDQPSVVSFASPNAKSALPPSFFVTLEPVDGANASAAPTGPVVGAPPPPATKP